MAERVVDLLEVVHVDEQDRRERAGVPAHALERLLQAIGEEAPVRKACEEIVERAVLHRVLGFLALDRVRQDVRDRDDEVDVALAEGIGQAGEHAEHTPRVQRALDAHGDDALDPR